MRQKLAGLEVSDGIDKNQSVGYQLYDRGQRLTAAAQSGLSPTQRAVAGAVTSAAENLAVAGGMFALAAFGAGTLSLDARRSA